MNKFLKFFSFDFENVYNSCISPSAAHANDNALASMWFRYLLMRAMSVFKWTLPDSFNERYFKYSIYNELPIAVFYTPEFGYICHQATPQKFDIYHQPSEVLMTVVKSKIKTFSKTYTRTVNDDCVLISLTEDYLPISDLISFYSGILAEMYESLLLSLKSSRVSAMFGAKNKNQADSFKKMIDTIMSGNGFAVAYDKELRDPVTGQLNIEYFNNNPKNTYLVTDLLNDIRSLIREFDTLIGINTSNTEKRERLINAEVQQNNNEATTMVDMWFSRLKKNCEDANNMFGEYGIINIEWRFDNELDNSETGVNNSESDN